MRTSNKQNYVLWIAVILLMSLAGCGRIKNVEGELSPEELKDKLDDKRIARLEKDAKVEGMFSELSLDSAMRLEKSRCYKKAVIIYKAIANDAPDEDMVEEAKLGLARCLLRMKNAAAAVSAVMPLSDDPVTSFERKSLALAGQAFLQMKDPTKAESLLEVALSGIELGRKAPKWVASTCANLAKAYIGTNKPNRSALMFNYAAVQYEYHKDLRNSARCIRMYNKIMRMLQQAEKDHTRYSS